MLDLNAFINELRGHPLDITVPEAELLEKFATWAEKQCKIQAWQEIEDWARTNGFVLIAERAGYLKAAQQSAQPTPEKRRG